MNTTSIRAFLCGLVTPLFGRGDIYRLASKGLLVIAFALLLAACGGGGGGGGNAVSTATPTPPNAPDTPPTPPTPAPPTPPVTPAPPPADTMPTNPSRPFIHVFYRFESQAVGNEVNVSVTIAPHLVGINANAVQLGYTEIMTVTTRNQSGSRFRRTCVSIHASDPNITCSPYPLYLNGLTLISPNGNPSPDARGNAYLATVNLTTFIPPSALTQRGITADSMNAYVASFPVRCNGGVSFRAVPASTNITRMLARDPFAPPTYATVVQSRRYDLSCVQTVSAGRGVTVAQVTIYKAVSTLLPLCWTDGEVSSCDLHFTQSTVRICLITPNYDGSESHTDCRRRHTDDDIRPPHLVVLAFPRQSYRQDGVCAVAPFYAVDSCQRENAVNFGNFAAFVSGLDGNGYRQFGVRHKWEIDDWQIDGLVSHARASEFANTWWSRIRLDRPLFEGARGFAEYESGITSLRQDGRIFEDLPIAGGRAGFSTDNFTMSFGRPMHHKGKGENGASLRWLLNKESTFSLRHSNGETDAMIEWRRRF